MIEQHDTKQEEQLNEIQDIIDKSAACIAS